MEIKTIVVYEYNEFTNQVYKDTPIWASYVVITKYGKKYIHYKHVKENFEPDGQEFKISKERIQVFDGIRKDIVEKVEKWKRDVQEWHERKKQAIYEFQEEARKIIDQKISEWEKNNPFPEFKIF